MQICYVCARKCTKGFCKSAKIQELIRCTKCGKDITWGSGNDEGSHRYADGTWLCNACDLKYGGEDWDYKKECEEEDQFGKISTKETQ